MVMFVKDAPFYGQTLVKRLLALLWVTVFSISKYGTRKLEGGSFSGNRTQKVKLPFHMILRHLNMYMILTAYFTNMHFNSILQFRSWSYSKGFPLKPYAMSF
jgi:hypothetical protein